MCQSTVEVNLADDTLVSATRTEKQEVCFQKGEDEWKKPEKKAHYEKAECQIRSAISDLFKRH